MEIGRMIRNQVASIKIFSLRGFQLVRSVSPSPTIRTRHSNKSTCFRPEKKVTPPGVECCPAEYGIALDQWIITWGIPTCIIRLLIRFQLGYP
uniref:Uncharacterized protein n=1 Tax=Arundo donax TaxID=35708 RepID=A0A0A9DKI8_ARUDO